jgi:CHAT domain-containing protein
VQIQQSSPDVAVQLQEEFQATQLVSSSGVQLYGQPPSVTQISRRLGELWQQTGKKPVFINVSVQSNQVETFTVLPTLSNVAQNNTSLVASTDLSSKDINQPQPTTVRKTIETGSRQIVLETATKFRKEVSDSRKIGQTGYLESAQQLYQWLIAPIEKELQANDIDIIVFSMDSGLRLLPIAALHDGQQFLIEKYAVALVPSFGLTDTRYVNISQSPILAMGASTFSDRSPLPPLPTVPFELNNITRNPRQGEIFLNERFTIENFEAQNRRNEPFRIIHLGTHAAFKAGNFNDSYIQFYDQKLRLPQLKEISDELGWNTTDTAPVELLVLSACETALGDEKAELGFAGLAVQAGVKSALASLWYVSDLGTLALMSEFYDQLSTTLIKAEALQQAQLGMLKGNVLVDDGQIKLSNGESLPLPSEFPKGQLELSHPYFWSAFTLIGNWN